MPAKTSTKRNFGESSGRITADVSRATRGAATLVGATRGCHVEPRIATWGHLGSDWLLNGPTAGLPSRSRSERAPTSPRSYCRNRSSTSSDRRVALRAYREEGAPRGANAQARGEGGGKPSPSIRSFNARSRALWWSSGKPPTPIASRSNVLSSAIRRPRPWAQSRMRPQ